MVLLYRERTIDRQEMQNLLTVGQSPSIIHFGVGVETMISRLDVIWPGGEMTSIRDVDVDQMIVVRHPDANSIE